MNSETDIDLGPCCACGKEGKTVRNILLLNKKALVPGTGWGCFVCHLPSDGASAVVCDECLKEKRPLKFAVAGFATMRMRVPIGEITEPFGHDEGMHALDEAGASGRGN